MLEFDLVQSCLTILLLIAAGELISRRLKAAVPAILVAGVLYIALLWCGVLPADLMERSGLTGFSSTAILLVILNMGTSINLRALWKNWRVVALSAAAFLLQLAVLFAVIGGVFGVNTAVGGLPGGMATALIVQERARSLGYDQFVMLSVLLLSTQGIVACPLVSFLIRKEAVRLHRTPCALPPAAAEIRAETPAAAKPAESHYWPLLRLFAAAWVAVRLELLTGISRYVLCLLLGVLLAEAGFFRRGELARTKSEGFLFLMMMVMVLSGFGAATPQMFGQMLLPLLCILACEMLSVCIFAALLGRALGFSREMSIGIGLNIMVGFPLNMMIAEDVIGYVTEDPAEREALLSQIATKLVIGGFTSTTFLAVFAAGILVGLMR